MALLLCDLDDTLVSRRSIFADWAAAGLAELVDACCISEAEGHWKPAPELFGIAADRCGHTLEGAWMIGDNPVTDIGGAVACGVGAVWIRMNRSWPRTWTVARPARWTPSARVCSSSSSKPDRRALRPSA